MVLFKSSRINRFIDSLNRFVELHRYKKTAIYKPLVCLKDGLRQVWPRYYVVQEVAGYNGLFFPVPKAGQTTLTALFRDMNMNSNKNIRQPGKFPANTHTIKTRYAKHLTFAFVRNPYDRLVSCYNDKVVGALDKMPATNMRKKGASVYFMNDGNFWPSMPFKEFIKEVCRIPDERANVHFRSQHYFLTDRGGKLLVEDVGKLEHLEKDFVRICTNMGLTDIPRLPHKNRTIRKRYQTYYDEETKRLVEQRYKKDLDLFGYFF